MITPIAPGRLAAAYCLDWMAGDPEGMPHPVRWIGAAIAAGQRRLLQSGAAREELLRGAALTTLVVAGTWGSARVLVRLGGPAGEVLLAWTGLATRSLLRECGAVLEALERGDTEAARRLLSRIVGRDTDKLDGFEIRRAVIETAAEGLCDGVVAPLFYLALGGAPLALAYKAVNTLDSMIGHPEPPYQHFGRVAARLDDGANFLPARISALAIIAAAFLTRRSARGSWLTLLRDGHKHPSPNAGCTEAAMAGALDVQLGGMTYYTGRPAPKPVLGAEGRRAADSDARASLRIVGIASAIVFAAAFAWLGWRKSRT